MPILYLRKNKTLELGKCRPIQNCVRDKIPGEIVYVPMVEITTSPWLHWCSRRLWNLNI